MSLSSFKKLVLLLVKIAAVLLAGFGALVGGVWYFNWSAERRARAFCDDIAIGSDISLSLDNATKQKIFHSDSPPYNFYFFSTGFDKAVCAVETDSNRKVTSRYSEMEYD
jgi:hypothetical protein